jgi:hypothetical protein
MGRGWRRVGNVTSHVSGAPLMRLDALLYSLTYLLGAKVDPIHAERGVSAEDHVESMRHHRLRPRRLSRKRPSELDGLCRPHPRLRIPARGGDDPIRNADKQNTGDSGGQQVSRLGVRHSGDMQGR